MGRLVPKPRRSGHVGGMSHGYSSGLSSRRGGNPGRSGGPPKGGCALLVLCGLGTVGVLGAAVSQWLS